MLLRGDGTIDEPVVIKQDLRFLISDHVEVVDVEICISVESHAKLSGPFL